MSRSLIGAVESATLARAAGSATGGGPTNDSSSHPATTATATITGARAHSRHAAMAPRRSTQRFLLIAVISAPDPHQAGPDVSPPGRGARIRIADPPSADVLPPDSRRLEDAVMVRRAPLEQLFRVLDSSITESMHMPM